MKMITRFAAVAAVALGTSAMGAHLDNPNQLTDPSFEGALTFDGPPFVGTWEGFNGSANASAAFTTNMPRTGAQSTELIIAGDVNSFAGVFQDVNIPASAIGEMSWFSGWHKLGTASDVGGSEYRIEWRDSAGNEFFRDQLTVSPGTEYEEFVIPAVIPAGTSFARIVYAVQSFGAAQNQQVFVDDVNFNFVPEPASVSLLALGGLAMLRRRRQG